ncbi:MAG: glycosyltransferase family protein, partial [Planctomycetota bacterium]
ECHYVGAVAYVIVNFFEAPLRIDSAVLAPPIVRPVVALLKATPGEHILLYSTTGTEQEQLLNILQKFAGQKFYIYGFNKSAEYQNCIFKKRSTEVFLADLAGSRGVIASAGFSLVSECMYLRKKMLLLPLAGQYEQIINAHYIQKLGLGISAERLDETILAQFLEELDKPVSDDKRILWPDNDKFFEILQRELNKLDTPVSIESPKWPRCSIFTSANPEPPD